MFDAERDILKAKAGAGSDLVYKNITGFKADLSVESKPIQSKEENAEIVQKVVAEPVSSEGGSSDDDDDNSDDDSDDKDGTRFKDSARPRDESPESKKLRKKAVKDAKAEKRQNKLKKHVKKRKEKQGTKKK